jgi:hypothetical protein
MAKGVSFHHPNKDVGTLFLRLPPTSVEWGVKLNTKVTDTYGGQVVQILSTSYDKLIVTGRFGKESAHGMNVRKDGKLEERKPEGYFDLGSRHSPRRGQRNPLEIGLSQMTAYFRRYFTVATAGGDHISPGGSFVRGAYNQQYMKLAYDGGLEDFERSWLVYPTSFPSYRRSNEDFAPEWRVEFEVVQPDFFIDTQNKLKAIDRLKKNIGYRPLNPFSDPLVQEIDAKNPNPKSKKVKRYIVKLTQDQLDTLNTSVFDYYGSMLNTPTPADLEELFSANASLPNIFERELAKMQGNLESNKKKAKNSRRSAKSKHNHPN